MKVLFFSAWYPSEQYPTLSPFVREHALAVQRYADIRVVCSAAIPGLPRPYCFEETVEHGLHTWRLSYRSPPLQATRQIWRVWGAYLAARALKQQGFQPDIIHANIASSALPALLLSQMFGVPVVMTMQETMFGHAHLGRFMTLYVRRLVNQVKRVMPISDFLRAWLRYHDVRVPMTVIPNTIDLSQFYPGERAPRSATPFRLLSVGRLVANKGFGYLLDAAALLRERGVDFHLDIVGDGEQRAALEAHVAELDLGDCVTLHGTLSKQEVADFMRRADVFVLASVMETQGVVLIEALASGLPVVATQIGGVDEVVGEAHGRLVPPRDPAALCAAIKDVLAGRAAYDPQALSDYVRGRYTYDVVGAQFEAVYRDVLGRD